MLPMLQEKEIIELKKQIRILEGERKATAADLKVWVRHVVFLCLCWGCAWFFAPSPSLKPAILA